MLSQLRIQTPQAPVLAYFDALIVRTGVQFGPDTGDGRSETDAVDATPGRRSGPPLELRSYDQQRHDLFAAMIRAATATIASGADAEVPVPAPVNISTEYDQLTAVGGTGTISGIEGPVPVSYLIQAACDRGIQLLLTSKGAVHALGTKGRFFTMSQRRAVAVRDGTTCVVPGCNVPFPALEAHHVQEHSRGGPTTVDNCVLVGPRGEGPRASRSDVRGSRGDAGGTTT